jgi:hypothetical protein
MDQPMFRFPNVRFWHKAAVDWEAEHVCSAFSDVDLFCNGKRVINLDP